MNLSLMDSGRVKKKETAKIVFEFWWFTLPNNLTIKILYENRLLYFYNRVSNKFGKILKGAYKSYSELTVFIEMMVSHDAWVVLNTYPSTNNKNPWKVQYRAGMVYLKLSWKNSLSSTIDNQSLISCYSSGFFFNALTQFWASWIVLLQ